MQNRFYTYINGTGFLYVCIFIFLISTCKSYGQKTLAIEAHYANRYYAHGFYDQLPNLSKQISFGQAPHWISIQAIAPFRYDTSSSIPLVFSASFMLPYNVTLNDSIRGKISAFHLGIPLMGRDLLKSTKVDLLVVGGLNVGSINLSANDKIHMQNPFVAPKLLVMPRVALGRFIISCMGEYSVDISSHKWKQSFWKPENVYKLHTFSQTGLQLSAGVGFWFNRK